MGWWGAVRKCLAGKLTFGQRPEGGEGGRAAAFIHLGEQCSEQREQQAQNLEAGRLLQVGEREQSMSCQWWLLQEGVVMEMEGHCLVLEGWP